jgi:hypothetical protein
MDRPYALMNICWSRQGREPLSSQHDLFETTQSVPPDMGYLVLRSTYHVTDHGLLDSCPVGLSVEVSQRSGVKILTNREERVSRARVFYTRSLAISNNQRANLSVTPKFERVPTGYREN